MGMMNARLQRSAGKSAVCTGDRKKVVAPGIECAALMFGPDIIKEIIHVDG